MRNNVFLSSFELSCNVWLDMNNNVITNLPFSVNSRSVFFGIYDQTVNANTTINLI